MAKDYETYINELANSGTDEIFYNSSDRHASIVLRALVTNAKNYIRIFCDSMCTDVSNNEEYLKLMKSFLSGDKSRKVSILFAHYDKNFDNQPIAALFKDYRSQVDIKKLNNGEIKYDGTPVHFTVADDKSFRLETDIDKKMAFGNFNDSNQALILKKVFDRFFMSDKAETISL